MTPEELAEATCDEHGYRFSYCALCVQEMRLRLERQVAEEREACAKLVDDYPLDMEQNMGLQDGIWRLGRVEKIAAAIRARSTPSASEAPG